MPAAKQFLAEHGDQLESKGLSAEEVNTLKAMGIPWATVLQVLETLGAAALPYIKSLIDAWLHPAPTPAP